MCKKCKQISINNLFSFPGKGVITITIFISMNGYLGKFIHLVHSHLSLIKVGRQSVVINETFYIISAVLEFSFTIFSRS